MEQQEVLADDANHRFLIEHDGLSAELVYRRGGGRLNLIHTEVPEEWRGRGVGGRLVKAALRLAGEEKLVVVPTCPYAQRWLNDHADEAGTVSIQWPASATRSGRGDRGSKEGRRDG